MSRRLQYLRSMDIDVWQRRDLVQSPAVQPVMIQPVIDQSATHQSRFAAQFEMPQPPVVQSVAATAAVTQSIQSSTVTGTADQVIAMPQLPTVVGPALTTWSDVEVAVRNCTRCALHTTRTQTVFGVGNRAAQWMIIGEAPGAEEDRQGEPFVGRAGQLLNSMLLAIGLQREQVFIANILKCRPPENRDPGATEVNCCMPYLQRQIELVNPPIILCVGRIAAQNLLSTDTPIGKLRGSVHYFSEQRRPVIVTYHPAYLLRSPGEKRKAWSDLQFALHTVAAIDRAST